ncbi:MAG: hypothetical protein HKP30_17425, partial [Myxococcales bacterium]|nr:hypothetical protein [Myxococcales bacterium]
MRRHCFSFLLLASFFVAASAQALMLDVSGQNFPGDATATITLTYDGTDTLTVEIENTADAGALTAAFVTGFAFNVPADVTGVSAFSASGTLDDAEWSELFPPGNAPGGYDFEGGAGTGNNIAGGTPNDGFGIGTTATFTFTFTGSNLNLLTEADFVGEFVSGAGGDADFGVRFQGIPVGAGSDFAVHTVPAPGAAALLAPALL